MIIDAMDLLYSGNIDAFALMTSDSDFTPLVLRILESGRPVYGFGSKKTPLPFVDACSPFIFVENLAATKADKADEPAKPRRNDKRSLRQDSALVRLLRTAVEQTSDDEGWASLGEVGQYISHNNSSFSTINYGYKKLSDLIQVIDLFETRKHNGNQLYVKDSRN
jgi:uncharacterized LabA/DUF88 family protein